MKEELQQNYRFKTSEVALKFYESNKTNPFDKSQLIKKLKNKNQADHNHFQEIISNYQNMINEEKYNSEILGELNVFDEIYMQPARKNCALLSSKSAVKILDGVDK